MTRLLTMREVAARLGYGYDWFRKHRAALERDHKFPAMVPGCGFRWDPRAIDRWLARQDGAEPAADPLTVDIAATLDARAAAIAERMQ